MCENAALCVGNLRVVLEVDKVNRTTVASKYDEWLSCHCRSHAANHHCQQNQEQTRFELEPQILVQCSIASNDATSGMLQYHQ